MQRISGNFTRSERLLIIPRELEKLTMKYVGKENIVIEPLRRNTAPAICLAALVLRQRFGNGVMHVMPADHIIRPKKLFLSALRYGQTMAEKGFLVTYGIKPVRPETGYGYIRTGERISKRGKNMAFHGAGFTEKPSLSIAKKYLRSRRYLWNSGIFTFAVDTILDEIQSFVPEVYEGVSRFLASGRINHFRRVPDISIDYGVMEKSKRLCVVQGNFDWDDVGSWLALERYFGKDRQGNILIGDAQGVEVANSIMFSQDVPLRAYGLQDVIVVVGKRGVLVCKKERAQDLKKLLK